MLGGRYVCTILVFKVMHLLVLIRVNHNFEARAAFPSDPVLGTGEEQARSTFATR